MDGKEKRLMKHEVIILGSECARVDHYAERVGERVRALGFGEEDCVISRVRSTGDEESLEILKKYGLADRCLIGYCAGCNFQQSFGDERYMPALIIDGTVVLHSCLPSDEVLDGVLKEYLV